MAAVRYSLWGFGLMHSEPPGHATESQGPSSEVGERVDG